MRGQHQITRGARVAAPGQVFVLHYLQIDTATGEHDKPYQQTVSNRTHSPYGELRRALVQPCFQRALTVVVVANVAGLAFSSTI